MPQKRKSSKPKPAARVRRALPLILLALAVALAAWGCARTRLIRLQSADVYLKDLPEAFDGTKVLYVRDFYAGRFKPPEAFRRLFEQIAPLEPDLLLLGGNYAGAPEHAEALFAALQAVRAPLGKFAAVGAADASDERLRGAMEAAAFTFLDGAAVSIELSGARLTVAALSLDDARQGDVRAIADAVRDEDCVLLLSPSADALPSINAQAPPGGGMIADLVLAAPGARYAPGFTIESGTILLAADGVGEAALPLRLGAPPRVYLLTLRRAQISFLSESE